MLTYTLEKAPGMPLYESLYRHIRQDILAGNLQAGQKLPSKRALAAHLEVSKITVEGAYEQLLSEGFIYAREKVGYFVENLRTIPPVPPAAPRRSPQPDFDGVDLTGGGPERFPFSVWSRLQRQVMLDLGQELLRPLPNQGYLGLRQAIADHLAAFRGMAVAPENILVGAGTDFLYNLLIQLLGRELCYAVEDPGYGKIRLIYAAGGARCVDAPMDASGPVPSSLEQAQVLHLSPNHHFPTGLVTPVSRRLELLRWAAEGQRWIIEDDYDSEFRFAARPMPAMQALDQSGRVIYMNTFSKTLAPSIRISYMVLPEALMDQFRQKLGFYSCTVPSFEQYTLERFLRQGYFEKHINRMRRLYKNRRNQLVELLKSSPIAKNITILEQDAGLHFLLRVNTELTDEALTERWAAAGIRIHALSAYYHGDVPEADRHCLIVNYDRLTDENLDVLAQRLSMLQDN
ncbi:MAG: PLP-dependent aminotransferase family protein [Oscillospiraceae bacterium]|nr:PLP-dependent aminotransferase family protein [Oscillospiraceae bacterium]